ncbi:MAG: hypothetical protein ACKOPT_05050, partial [Cyanobium sp.]
VRLQSHLQKSEAATRDLQDVSLDLAVRWHLPPERLPMFYQRLGDPTAILEKGLEPCTGHLPLVLGNDSATPLLDFKSLLKADRSR